jgi:hypothetical protein
MNRIEIVFDHQNALGCGCLCNLARVRDRLAQFAAAPIVTAGLEKPAIDCYETAGFEYLHVRPQSWIAATALKHSRSEINPL